MAFTTDSQLVVDGGRCTGRASLTVYSGAIIPGKVTSDPCAGALYPEGVDLLEHTADIVCYFDASGADLNVADDAACF